MEIDGSYGEGGGQILRTAVAMAVYTGTPVVINNIRQGRPDPGVQAQHLAGVKALASLCRAEVTGLHQGSQTVCFRPGETVEGPLDIDIGTAGAIGLVFQATMVPAARAERPVHVEVRGGTDVAWAPSVIYLREVTLRLLGTIGFHGRLELHRRGYFPRGGGYVVGHFHANGFRALDLVDRGDLLAVRGVSHASTALRPRGVAERQRDAALEVLSDLTDACDIEIEYGFTHSPGSGIDLWAVAEHSVLGGTALGARRKRAEEVGREAARALVKQIISRAALDEWMGDQILPFVSLARGVSRFSVPVLTRHLKTNLWVIRRFLPVSVQTTKEDTRTIVEVTSCS